MLRHRPSRLGPKAGRQGLRHILPSGMHYGPGARPCGSAATSRQCRKGAGRWHSGPSVETALGVSSTAAAEHCSVRSCDRRLVVHPCARCATISRDVRDLPSECARWSNPEPAAPAHRAPLLEPPGEKGFESCTQMFAWPTSEAGRRDGTALRVRPRASRDAWVNERTARRVISPSLTIALTRSGFVFCRRASS